MKKSVYLTIITLVTVACIIAGSIYHIAGYGKSFFNHFSGNMLGNNWIQSASGSYGDIENNSVDLDEFHSMVINLNVMDVTIVEGGAFTLSYNCREKLAPEYEVKSGTLNVKQSSDIDWGIGNNNGSCEMTITIPAGTKLDSVEVSTDVGDITLHDIQAASSNLTADVGDINLENYTSEAITVSEDVGDIKLTNCSFDNFTATSSVGDVDLKSISNLDDYTLDLQTDIGDVKVGGKSHDMDYERSGSSSRKIKVSSNCGDIHLSK